MKVSFIVKHRDGVETAATVWPSTELHFERKFSIAWSEAWTVEAPFSEHLYWAAWRASTEAGLTSQPFEEWINTIANVTPKVEDTVPLAPAPPPGSSER